MEEVLSILIRARNKAWSCKATDALGLFVTSAWPGLAWLIWKLSPREGKYEYWVNLNDAYQILLHQESRISVGTMVGFSVQGWWSGCIDLLTSVWCFIIYKAPSWTLPCLILQQPSWQDHLRLYFLRTLKDTAKVIQWGNDGAKARIQAFPPNTT